MGCIGMVCLRLELKDRRVSTIAAGPSMRQRMGIILEAAGHYQSTQYVSLQISLVWNLDVRRMSGCVTLLEYGRKQCRRYVDAQSVPS